MFEDFLNALQSFARNRMRTILSLLGVIIGVASVIVITALGASSTKQIENTFGSSGLDLVSITNGYIRRRNMSSSTVLSFDETFRKNIFNNIDNIQSVWYKNSLSASLSYEDISLSSNVTAVETGYLEICGLDLDYGEYFSVTDDIMGTQKIILGSEIAEGLFPDGNAIGRNITLVTSNVSFNFKVIGVLKKQTSGMESSTTGIYITRGFYSKKISPNPNASIVILQATKKDYTTKMVTDVSKYCSTYNGQSYSVNVMSMQTMIEQMSEITNTLSLMLSAIAAISLLVGGIGIMNIMIVTVTERKQEIGIRKALGASPSVIKRQFLVESASITLMGGITGIIIGIGISFAVEYVRSQTLIINWSACFIAFIFSVFVGIFFGLNPASRAAKLDPVEALSGE